MHNKKVSAFLSISTLKMSQTKMIAEKLPHNRHELFIPYAFNYNTLTRMRKFTYSMNLRHLFLQRQMWPTCLHKELLVVSAMAPFPSIYHPEY